MGGGSDGEWGVWVGVVMGSGVCGWGWGTDGAVGCVGGGVLMGQWGVWVGWGTDGAVGCVGGYDRYWTIYIGTVVGANRDPHSPVPPFFRINQWAEEMGKFCKDKTHQ